MLVLCCPQAVGLLPLVDYESDDEPSPWGSHDGGFGADSAKEEGMDVEQSVRRKQPPAAEPGHEDVSQ